MVGADGAADTVTVAADMDTAAAGTGTVDAAVTPTAADAVMPEQARHVAMPAEQLADTRVAARHAAGLAAEPEVALVVVAATGVVAADTGKLGDPAATIGR
jgi:hypothetical protein